MDDFKEYKKLGEPLKKERSEIWQAAIGLQDVDGLKPSEYLIKTAKQNIEGEITIYEVKERLNEYYNVQKPIMENRTEEADKVSARVVEILGEKTFTFSPSEYLTIHKRLFSGILSNKIAGKIRDYNIEKKEWVLNGETVYYASADSIKAALDYDFAQEKEFKYKGLNDDQRVEHIAKFISGIWQIHAFGEGNTRATAVLAIKYLRTFGFAVENDLFAENSWYFRNALVRANYNDHKNNVHSTIEYLNKFFANLLLSEQHELKNSDLRADLQGHLQGHNLADDPVKFMLQQIKNNPKITYDELAELIGKSRATVKRAIQKLKQEGVIERIGSDKTGHWEVVE